MLVSVDNHCGWPEVLFLTNPTADKVLEFLKEYIAQNEYLEELERIPEQRLRAGNLGKFAKTTISNT